MTAIRWLQAHRRLARLVSRGPVRSWISRRVWAELEADPEFVAAMKRGQDDLTAGRFYRWHDRTGLDAGFTHITVSATDQRR